MSGTFDDYDFTPTSNSSLASLFDGSSETSDNASLIYTAPKQPKFGVVQNEPVKAETKADTAVICAKVVKVWKVADAKFFNVGKLGLALIASSTQPTYEMIVYKDKKNVITRIKICSTVEISLISNNCISFVDNVKDRWLLQFNTFEDKTSIVNHIQKYGAKIIREEKANGSFTDKTKNVENEDSFGNKAKADILSRIAKMGQSILPTKNLDHDDESLESAESDITNSSSHCESNSMIHPVAAADETHIIHSPRQISHVPTSFTMNHPMPYDPLSLYVAENRCHNNEVKINLGQISEKLNNIMMLVDARKTQSEPTSEALKSKIKVLQLKNDNSLKELTNLREENLKLKAQVQQQNVMLNDQEEHTLKMKFEKEEEMKKTQEVRLQVDHYKNKIAGLSEIIEKQRNQIEQLHDDLGEREDCSQLKMDILELESTISDLKLKLKQSEKSKTEQSGAISSSQQELCRKNADFIASLKEEMNNMYTNIISSFSVDQSYISDINSIIAQSIKSTTLNIIHKLQQIYDVHNDPN